MIYSIPILTKKPKKVVFSSKTDKDSYIKDEFKATTSARNWRYTCGLSDLKAAILALAAAQFAFAIKCGFEGSKHDKHILKRRKATNETA